MSNSKKMLSFLLAVIIIIMSVVSSGAIIISDDTVSPKVEWVYKIDKYLIEKMADASETDLIPVWVWMTDIDMEQLDKDIEVQTGISQQKLDTARANIGYDVSTMSANVEDLMSTDANVQNVVTTRLEATKAQREKIANDTKVYLTAKKQLASQRYTAANTAKISKLDVSSDRIDFQSELTPSFIAFLTKSEIVETAKSADVVEIGYFSEYDAELEVEQTQARAMAEEEEQTEAPTVIVEEYCEFIKQDIQYNTAFEKYNLTGSDITVLYIDNSYVDDDHDYYNQLPKPTNIINYVDGTEFSPTTDVNVPYNGKMDDHSNYCVNYLQNLAENVEIYVVAKNSRFDYINQEPLDPSGENNDNRINTYDDIEKLIETKSIDIINASNNDGYNDYGRSFSAQWFDAIVAVYNIPLIASNGNSISDHPRPLAPAIGYNSIAVGVYDYENNRMFEDFTYTTIIDAQTRVAYKPDLVVAMDGKGATSAGAPTVSAIVAMMMELDSSLKGCPEIIKAILMASCQEKADLSTEDQDAGYEEDMEDGLTLKQGAGKVNALRALNIVAFGTYGYVSMYSTDNYVYAPSINLNSEVYGNSNVNYPLNVSIAWLRENRKSSNNENDDDTNVTLGTKHELNLRVSYTGQTDIKESTTVNSGKQLVFYESPTTNKNYRVRIYRGSEVVNNNEDFLCGYAYSVGNFEKALERVEITGPTAIGKTLTATAYTADGTLAETSALYYDWYSSSDGEHWTWMRDVHTPTYILTPADKNKYFYCEVTQDYLCDIYRNGETTTSVVLYGDVNNDGDINSLDATIIQRYVLGLIELTPEEMLSADVNGDNIVDDEDASLIQQYSSGVINKFPVED